MLDEKDLQAIAQLIKAQVDPINKRLDTLEGTMATKDDLVAMATKGDLDRVLVESKIMQEGYFDPKFDLLGDQLKLVQEKMLPMEALDDAEDRLDVLEAVVKNHSREIRELKKAQ